MRMPDWLSRALIYDAIKIIVMAVVGLLMAELRARRPGCGGTNTLWASSSCLRGDPYRSSSIFHFTETGGATYRHGEC